MKRLMPALWLAFAALPGLALTTRPAGAEDQAAFRATVAAAYQRDWGAAAQAAARSGPVAQAVADWMRLRSGGAPLADYRAWLDAHPDWPDQDRIRARAEAAAIAAPPPQALGWFAENPPATVDGSLARIDALALTGQDARAAVALGQLWRTTSLTAEQEAALRARFGAHLAPHHRARLEIALTAGRWDQAERLLVDVNPVQADLARARIALQARREGVDGLIRALPEGLRDHAGLTRDRFQWRLRTGQLDGARALLDTIAPAAMGDPGDWSAGRLRLAREALAQADWAGLRQLAAGHGLTSGGDFADLEWLAGYGALKAGEPYDAIDHFAALRTGVSTPISLSRAAYWEGRAYEQAGDLAGAHLAYAHAVAVGGSAYYGQLAAERAGLPMPEDLTGLQPLPDWRGAPALRDQPMWQAAVWLWTVGEADLSRRFLLQLARTLPEAEVPRVARFALELNQPNLALMIGKAAALRGIVIPAALYPTSGIEADPLPVAPDLTLAIARRESEFNPVVTSQAGALGLMQVMPDTGRAMATELAIPFDQGKMTDPDYNALLGTAYLAHLQDQFGASVAMVAAGYNAGPGRPRRWATANGDPRDPAVDVVDWVEAIPFAETRNYVMRVAEAIPLYRARLAGGPVPWGIEAALRGSDPAVVPEPTAPVQP
ncbi:transglycosylase SLT domain-containing protein [Paracoccus sp. p3-h83]|uniref:lytic transglycosylase domain-containing protein n=1 Tax=Paracoccus sp. p3-h83 TaxID=3342805 RepID=UPI0035B8B286